MLPLEATPAGHHAPNLARAGASEEDGVLGTGLRYFAISQMGFAVLPLSNTANTL